MTTATELRQTDLDTWRLALAEDTFLDPMVWECLHELGETTDDQGDGLVTASHELLAGVVGLPTSILRHCLRVAALEGWLLLAEDEGGDRAVYRLTDPNPLPLEDEELDTDEPEDEAEGHDRKDGENDAEA